MSVETLGMWSLLKEQDCLLILTRWVWSRNRQFANALRNRQKCKPGSLWRPLEFRPRRKLNSPPPPPLRFENPRSRFWPQIQQLDFEQQREWLDSYYYNLQDRVIVADRRAQRRKSRDTRFGSTHLRRSRRKWEAKKRRQALGERGHRRRTHWTWEVF